MRYRIRHTDGTLINHWKIQRQIFGPIWLTIGRSYGEREEAEQLLQDIIQEETKTYDY